MSELPVRLEELISSVDRADGEPLELLTDAVILSGRLGDLADEVVDHFVQNAREAGASWADIGASMGVSKQAAQKRFVTLRPVARRGRSGLLTRFDPSARSAVKTAVRRAHELGSHDVGTLHLVLGLCEEGSGRARDALSDLAGSVDGLSDEARSSLGEPADTPTRKHIPFTDGSKKVLELALREAIRSETRNIGSEHILLGVLRDEKSSGAKLLNEHGVSHNAVESWLEENGLR